MTSLDRHLTDWRRKTTGNATVVVARIIIGFWLLSSPSSSLFVEANPSSKPYIPFRTDPYDQPQCHHSLVESIPEVNTTKRIRLYEPEKDTSWSHSNDQCPLQFSLGVSRRSHDSVPGLGGLGSSTGTASTPMGIQQAPIIYPILPWQGPGRQVLYTTQYEHLDLLTPSKGSIHVDSSLESANNDNNAAFSKSFIAEGLIEHVEFPLLFESSAFRTSPIIADVNKDGILDAILTDYHGGIYAIGLQIPRDRKQRYFHKTQVPRLYVRRQWMESMVNETLGIDPYEAEKKAEAEEEARKATEAEAGNGEVPKDKTKRIRARKDRPHDPYHSYFEYSYGSSASDHETILRGVTADLLGQDQDHAEGLEERRKRRVNYERKVVYDSLAEEKEREKIVYDSVEEEKNHEKVVYDSVDEEHQQEKVVYDSMVEERKQEKVVYDSVEEEHQQEKVAYDSMLEEKKQEKVVYDSADEDKTQEKDVFDSAQASEIAEAIEENAAEVNHRRLQEIPDETSDSKQEAIDGTISAQGDDVYWGVGDDLYSPSMFVEIEDALDSPEDRIEGNNFESSADAVGGAVEHNVPPDYDDIYSVSRGDDTYPRYDDYSRGMFDDYYGGRYNSMHEDYFDDKHYVRLPPHILSTPTIVEMPKMYSNNGETEYLLFVAVSYYFDEDEYEGFFSYKRFENSDHGDETEIQRGIYVASAIMMYHFGDNPRWGRQEHLDLSGDHSAPVNMTVVGSIPMREDNSKLGAFALASPILADIDGDGNLEVLMGTSMGLLYVLDARNLFAKENWPVQFKFGIESRVIVEDVRGDTNLEIFVADVGGNAYCLDHTGKIVWHRNLLQTVDSSGVVLGSSPMVLGDVDGDGLLDIVVKLKIRSPREGVARYLFALSADSGRDLDGFPLNIWTKPRQDSEIDLGEAFVHEKLPPALLVDLHGDQDHVLEYIRRNGTKWIKRGPQLEGVGNSRAPHGGKASGLHIVQPIDKHLVIVEGGSGCLQSIDIGEDILSMVQVDDVHGTNKLDLIVSTVTGNVITLESQAPYHPLNVWNNGELRARTGGSVHGYTASQGIFVHDVSRQFRDIFGVYVPVTFEIFDNRPNILNEPDKRKYKVEIREGTSRLVFLKEYDSSGLYTERFFIPYGPGFYQLSVILKSTHGLVYEDAFHIGYNVKYMDGFGILLWLPLTIATIAAFLMGSRNSHWDDDDYQGDSRNGRQGILGNLPD